MHLSGCVSLRAPKCIHTSRAVSLNLHAFLSLLTVLHSLLRGWIWVRFISRLRVSYNRLTSHTALCRTFERAHACPLSTIYPAYKFSWSNLIALWQLQVKGNIHLLILLHCFLSSDCDAHFINLSHLIIFQEPVNSLSSAWLIGSNQLVLLVHFPQCFSELVATGTQSKVVCVELPGITDHMIIAAMQPLRASLPVLRMFSLLITRSTTQQVWNPREVIVKSSAWAWNLNVLNENLH